MPLFSAQLPNLQAAGPIVDVQIMPSGAAVAAIVTAGGSIPPPLTLPAMIDTGATGSVIQQGIAQQLGINPIGTQLINTPSSHGVLCYQYLLQLALPASAVGIQMPVRFELVVIEAPLKGQHIRGLLGRDFLAHGIFVYVGPSNTFTFSF